MKETGLRITTAILLGWSRMTDRRRRAKIKKAVKRNEYSQKCIIEIKVDRA